MSNKQARNQLNIKYGARCLLTNVKLQTGSYHHIEKREFGGKTNVENGANLNPIIHQWIHNEIEKKDIELFYLINECLLLYKKCLDLGKVDLIEMYEKETMPIFRQKMFEYNKKLTKKKMLMKKAI